jgi:hypothetical protein
MFTLRKTSLVLSAALAAGLLSAANTRADFNPALDFSPTNNPNGVWTCGSMITLGSTFFPYKTYGNDSGLDFWEEGVSSSALPPYVAHNGSSSMINYGTLPYLSGQLGLHPGPTGHYAVSRFTAPQNMTLAITGSFFKIDPYATTDVHILDNSVAIFDGTIGTSSAAAFSIARCLTTGETIDFAVGYGNGSYYNDSSGLNAILTSVPEPSGLALFAGGLVILLGYSRSRRNT